MGTRKNERSREAMHATLDGVEIDSRGHLPLFGRFALEGNLSVYGVQFGFDRLEKPNLLTQWRILFFAGLLPRIAIFGGPTLSALRSSLPCPAPSTSPHYLATNQRRSSPEWYCRQARDC